MFQRTALGHGIGLRPKHYGAFLEEKPTVAFVEAISENFMATGGRPMKVLEKVRQERPVVLHGVSLSIGASAPLNNQYLKEWKALVQRIEPALVSDHLCWGTHGGRNAHDLLPLPFTDEAVTHVVSRVVQVQEVLGRQILLENVSSYLTFKESTMAEWDFLVQVALRADCGILLDINNIYVSAKNHGFDALEYINAIPPERVGQFHLAGHMNRGDILIDTHEGHVAQDVWALYRHAVKRFGAVPSLVEWDTGVPELPVLLEESRKAAALETEVLA